MTGPDAPALARRLVQDRETFLTTGTACDRLRPLVVESWSRSLRLGMDPAAPGAPVELTGADLDAYRADHALAQAMPIVRRLLVERAAEAGLIVAVSDDQGRLLWVEGCPALRRRAERMRFVAGARWSEAAAGTNAPGTCLALGEPVQIFAAEHLAYVVTPWSCAAAPVRGPDGRVLGAIDITGGDDVAGIRALLLVRATAAAVEAELRAPARSAARPPPGTTARRRTGTTSRPARDAAPVRGTTTLRVLGQRSSQLVTDHGTRPLRLRHAEILLLLAHHPLGLSGEQLAILVSDRSTRPVTQRVEVSRLREVLEQLTGVRVRGNPYRLVGPLCTDIDEVRRHLARGDLRRALDAYAGPVLPASVAPGVQVLRERLALDVRACALASPDPSLLWQYANRPDAADDVEVWQACLRRLPGGSPLVPLVRGRLRALDHELG